MALHPRQVRDRSDAHARLHAPDADVAVVEAQSALRARGERLTDARSAVIAVLADHPEPVGAEDLVSRLSGRHPGIHRSTVYRTLELLTEIGIIVQLQGAAGGAQYHLAVTGAGNEHLHARCRTCGGVVGLPADLLDAVTLRLTPGFALDPSQSLLVGVCGNCLAGRGGESGVGRPN